MPAAESRQNWDTPWKEIFECFFHDFLECCYPAIAAEICWEKGHEFLDKELQMISASAMVGKKIVDKLVKVWRKSGEEGLVLIHLEVQGQKDPQFPQRMFSYYALLFHQHQLPVASIAILIDSNKKWRPCFYESGLWETKLRYEFTTLKMLDYEGQRETLAQSTNPFAVVLLAQLEAITVKKSNHKIRLASKLSLTRKLYQKGFSREQVFNLYRFIDWLIHLPKGLMVEYHRETHKIEEETKMVYVTTAERIGMQQGMQKGRQRGLLEGELKIFTLQLQQKFSAIPMRYKKYLKEADAEQILAWAKRLLKAKTLEDIFQDN